MPMDEVTDEEIERRIHVRKYQIDAIALFRPEESTREIHLEGEDGRSYRLLVQNEGMLKFHIQILSVFHENWEVLIRYDYSAAHINLLEGKNHRRIDGFHIHRLTERYYQAHEERRMIPVDGYAEMTDAYHDLRSAWAYARRELNIVLSSEMETELFYRPWFIRRR